MHLQALKIKAEETESSLSEIVNLAVRFRLEEDLADLNDIKARESEGTISYETFLEELKGRGQI